MAQTHTKPALAIVKLDDVPGPEADAGTLNQHYQRVQREFATHRYDDVIMSCHWCCDSENDLVFSKPDRARGTRMFCSARCANCFSAYEVKVLRAPAKPLTVGKGQPAKAEETDEAPPPKAKRRSKGAPIVQSDETAAPDEERSDWKPVGERGRKPRKARAKSPQRTDGKCSKGEHEMTEANTYSYNGGTWCRACRKASRSKSNGNGGKA